eukprot:GFUD01022519.1.p1 GENE.GFUD01022519.1~~GFUD01022519.1.p1  ORF type:complete len:464 (+),score=144.27 GFUD01022519.1:285-1676(+)
MLFLFWCVNEHQQFRLAEFESLSCLLDVPLVWVFRSSEHPWVILDMASQKEAVRIISRSISVKYCLHLWAEGNSYQEFHTNLRKFPFQEQAKWLSENISFKVHVESFNRKISVAEQLEKIESLSYIPLQGPVSLNSPQVTFSYFEFHGFDRNNLPEEPLKIMFGRLVGEGQREKITKLSIKKRKFIGNTTMDPQLSLLMANLGAVAAGRVVLDPFVGTGSLLVAAAEFGGLVLGGDIDYLTLHARTRPSRVGQKVRAEDESMVANFEQYGLTSQYLGVIAGDFSQSPWRDQPWLDCVVTDPPYGIREGTTRVGTEKDFSTTSIPEEYLDTHVPEKVAYTLQQLVTDLLNFSARSLRVGGRLVYWLPVIRQNYRPDRVPSHPGLRLVADCEQVLSSHTSRRLLVMERVEGEGKATVSKELTMFKEQFYLPVAGNISRKERKERIKEHGHLNLSEQEIQQFTKQL